MGDARAPNYELAEIDYISGMKYKDIAEKYNVTLNTVKSWKTRYNWSKGNKKGVHTKSEKVCTQKEDISWIEIENEYVTDIRKNPCSLDDLSAKYKIPIQTIKDQSAKKEWSKKRAEYKLRTSQKAIEKSIDKDADRILKLLSIADIAASKAEQSLGELESYIVKNKQKTKTIEYKDKSSPGKPTKEIINEEESIDMVSGPIDRQGLLFVTSTLKNIKELYAITSNAQMQEHKIEYDKRKLELEIIKQDAATRQDNQEPEGTKDNFIEMLNAKAIEVWDDEE